MSETKTIPAQKNIALVAHDYKKDELIKWVQKHSAELKKHHLIATGTTGKMLEKELNIQVKKILSGPLGGDQQMGSMIATGEVDMVIFFWDPMEAQPHDSDVKALLRLGVVWNIPTACCTATADFIISSPFMSGSYEAEITDYSKYLDRKIDG